MSAIILAFFKNFDLHITIHDNFTANDSKELGPALEKKKKLEIITFTDKTTSEHHYILMK